MLSLFLDGIFKIFPALAQQYLDYRLKQASTEIEGFQKIGSLDLAAYQAYLNAQVETNKLKLAQQSWWGARLIILVAGLSCTAHFSAVIWDSLPWLGHVVGSWQIPKLPSPYDTYEWAIVQSFFILAPATPVFNAVSLWLARKR